MGSAGIPGREGVLVRRLAARRGDRQRSARDARLLRPDASAAAPYRHRRPVRATAQSAHGVPRDRWAQLYAGAVALDHPDRDAPRVTGLERAVAGRPAACLPRHARLAPRGRGLVRGVADSARSGGAAPPVSLGPPVPRGDERPAFRGLGPALLGDAAPSVPGGCAARGDLGAEGALVGDRRPAGVGAAAERGGDRPVASAGPEVVRGAASGGRRRTG